MEPEHDKEVSQRAVRPPVLLLALVLVGWGLDHLWAMPFMPAGSPNEWIGVIVFLASFGVVGLAFREFRRNGTNVRTNQPSTALVDTGPFRLSRNPIYLAMIVAIIGIAIAVDSLWVALAAVPFYLVIRYFVIAHEESYLERRFGDAYRAYKARVRRWI